MNQICSKCGIEKELSEFYFRKDSNKYRNECKPCLLTLNKSNKKEYREKNKEILSLKNKEYREKNKDKIKSYYDAHKKHASERASDWNKKNAERRRIICKKHCDKNKGKIREYRISYLLKNKERTNKNARERRRTSINYRIKCNLSNRIWNGIYRNVKTIKTLKLLGCTIEEFKSHLESQFTSEMSWDNYGSYWHIDHILPCAAFDLRHSEEQELCFAWWNMRPLEAKENLVKGGRLIYGV